MTPGAVGVITGLLFLVSAAEESVLAYIDRKWWWMWGLFAVLLSRLSNPPARLSR